MVWVPRGPLVVGSPEGSLPRLVDQELPGEQVIINGYYIDVFPYPNEEGAIALAGVSRDAAVSLCVERGKRLCSELEWERACKGPNNTRYEYGEGYRAERCGTGAEPMMRPSGMRVGCKSGFGVRDMHGGGWEWTSSNWGRGSAGDLVTIRGGTSAEGEVVGRCANGRAARPDRITDAISFRCCAGTPNTLEVVLDVSRGRELEPVLRIDKPALGLILAALPATAAAGLDKASVPSVDRQWVWRPVANEELYVTRVCTGLGQRPVCGVSVTRRVFGQPMSLAWASSRHWLPTLDLDRDPRELWMIGGDETGTFQRLIEYRYGTVTVTAEEHRARQDTAPHAKKRRSTDRK